MSKENSTNQEQNSEKLEFAMGLTVAVLAAILALIDLAAGKYGDDFLVAVNKKVSAYELFHGKVIKETLLEGERDVLKNLILAGAIVPKDTSLINKTLADFDSDLRKIEKQKKEILEGSAKVGKANWVQPDPEGNMGKVIGAKEWEILAEKYDKAGNHFNISIMFMQICLVLGAIGFITKGRRNKLIFEFLMIAFGLIGIIYGLDALRLAF